ncbi:unnamed protein product [Durusdinium trenchii]|uniref:Uncharacterized protein n=1 Tax=Durusdinium trenchii TaxID=1381693 RepID=A0ABP0H7U8_9DINO
MAEPIFLWLLVLLGTWLVLLLFGGCRSAVHASSRGSSAAVAPGSERSARSPGAAAEALRACRQMAMEDTGGAGEGLQVTCPSHLRYRACMRRWRAVEAVPSAVPMAPTPLPAVLRVVFSPRVPVLTPRQLHLEVSLEC